MSVPLKKLRIIAIRRRLGLAILVAISVLLAAIPMARFLAVGGWSILKVAFFALFLLLFSQVAFSSLVAVAGWWVLFRKKDEAQLVVPRLEDISGELPATAIVMPVFNEDVNRVFQGLRAMYESLRNTGRSDSFDFFILSDSNNSNCWIAEEKAWFELCKQVQGFGRIFYRKRRVQAHHKSGNIADFCRRWGANYRYMLVLDADSVMTGAAMVRLTALMEQRPGTGIIQTTTMPILGQNLFQRMEQFAAFAYRPLFATGASFWQLRDASYYGHNAIIRLKPFMQHCAMPELPEVGPLGTHILSHDTIEAALIRRAGFEVWQVPGLAGTFEEGPPHLVASLKRDRRWCHGNLQHVWFLFERRLKTVSRFNILNGILAYGNSPLWFFSLVLGVFVAIQNQHAAVPAGKNPFMTSWVLYGCIMGLLFLPKILGALLLIQSPEKSRLSGSRARAILFVLKETVYSMILAPILMLFYTRFVLASIFGFKVGWGPQVRSDENGPSWATWISVHAANLVFVLAAIGLIAWRIPSLLLWMTPVFIGPLLAIPFSRLTASNALGQKLRTNGWLVTPEEAAPPPELEKLEDPFVPAAQPYFQTPEYARDYGLLQAVLDPYVNAIHVSLLRQRPETGGRTRDYMRLLAERLLVDGPFALSPAEKRTLLWDAEAMSAMHQKLWGSPASHLHEWWQAAFRNYVEDNALSSRRKMTFRNLTT